MEPDRRQADSWLGVELRHLAALEAVAREGSFGRAAESLGYTQSAISQQIQTLERLVGERLLERPGGPRAVSLTEAGGLLLRHAEAIVARLHAAQADMAALAQGQAADLRDRHVPERRRARAAGRDAPLPRRVAAGRGRADRVGVRRRPAPARRARRARSRVRDAAAARRPVRSRSSCSPTRTCSSSPRTTSWPSRTRASLAEVGDLTLIGNRACRSTVAGRRRADAARRHRRRRLSLGRQRHRPGPRRSRLRRRARAAARDRPQRRADPRARARSGDPAAADRARLASRPPSLARGACVRRVAGEVCAEVGASLAPVAA